MCVYIQAVADQRGRQGGRRAWSPKVFCRAQLSYDRARFSYRPRRSVCLSHAGNDSKLMTIGSRGSPDFSLLTANFVRASVENGGGGQNGKNADFRPTNCAPKREKIGP